MSEGIKIDFSALKDHDYVGSYVNAFKVGQALGERGVTENVTGGNALTDAAPNGEDTLRAHVAGMSAGERARAGEQADLLAGLGQGLKSVPYTERPAVLAHLKPALAARGVPPSAITAFDPTDENLDAAVASARSMGMILGAAG